MEEKTTKTETKIVKKTPPKEGAAKIQRAKIVREAAKDAKARQIIKKEPIRLGRNIPACVTHFASALVDPFDTPPGVCIPAELFPIPSAKARTFKRGTFALGTTGVGYFIFRPCTGNDIACAIHTTDTSVGTQSTQLVSFTNVVSPVYDQLPYTNAQMVAVPGVQSRVAGLGLRVRYIGEQMKTNGEIAIIELPAHSSLLNETYNSVLSSIYSSVCFPYMGKKSADEWDASVCYSGPVIPNDVAFVGGTSTPQGAANYIGLVISGTAGDKYAYELVEHLEFVGTAVINKTMSHSEPELLSKVLETAKDVTAVGPLKPEDKPSFFQRFAMKIQDSLPYVIGIGKAAFKLYEGDMTGVMDIFSTASKMFKGSSGTTVGQPGNGFRNVNSVALHAGATKKLDAQLSQMDPSKGKMKLPKDIQGMIDKVRNSPWTEPTSEAWDPMIARMIRDVEEAGPEKEEEPPPKPGPYRSK